MTTPARHERHDLCDLFLQVGPDAPTLCEGWTTRDLAAHLVVRERRPDAAPGVFVDALAAHTEKVRLAEAERPFPEIVERVRKGPPRWNPMRIPPVDEVVNTVEFFVHHEDVRRARPGWRARTLTPDLEHALLRPLKRMGLLVRKVEVGLVVQADGQDPMVLRKGEPAVTVTGPTGELVLYLFGRRAVAAVELDGPPDTVAALEETAFGF